MNEAFFGIDPVFILYVGVFLGVLLAFEGIRQLLSRSESLDAAKSRRMKLIEAGTTPQERLRILAPPRRKSAFGKLPFVHDLPELLQSANLRIHPLAFLGLGALGVLVIAAAGAPFFGPLQAAGLGLLVCLLVPVLALRLVRQQRRNKLGAQLPDALDLMARGLKVGHPLNTTVVSVASDMPDPIATEFGILVDQVSYGEDLVTAFRNLAERIDTEDYHYLAVSVAIQHGTGGNLARVLGVLSDVIRGRATMRRKIRAISSEGRISAQILSVLPFVIVGLTMMTAPSYFRDVATDPAFRPMAIVALVLVAANAYVLFRLVRFRF